MKAITNSCLLLFCFLFSLTVLIPAPVIASEWIIEEDVIGAPPGPGFDQDDNLYYYSGLFSALRIRTPSGTLSRQIGLSSPPFSGSGFSTIDVRDMVVTPDGTTYFLLADDYGYSATAVKIAGLQSDHQTVVSWQLTYNDLTAEYPSQIAVDADNNLLVMTCGYYSYQGARTTFIDSVLLTKYNSAGQQLWTRPLEFLLLFDYLRPRSDSFFPLLFTDQDGVMIYVANQGDFWLDPEHSGTSPTNIMLSGINGSDGSVRFSKKLGESFDVSSGSGHQLSVLTGNFGGRPSNGAVDSSGRLLLLGTDEQLANGFQTQSGAYWLFIDKDGAISWQRHIGESLPTTLAGPNPDLVGSVVFDSFGLLHLLGRQNASEVSGNSTLAATGAYVARFDLSSGDSRFSAVAAPLAGPVQTAVVSTDHASNIYISQGITGSSWQRFIEKNPHLSPLLTVQVAAGLQDRELVAGIGVDAASLEQIPVLNLTLEATAGDFTVASLTLTSRGTGAETTDLARARLKLPDGPAVIASFSSLGSGSTPSKLTFSGINRTLSAGSTETWQIEYDFSVNACAMSDGYTPGSSYIAQLPAAATLNGAEAVQLSSANTNVQITPGEGPAITLKTGSLSKDSSTDNQSAEKNSNLGKMFKAVLSQHSAVTACAAKVIFSVKSKPQGAANESLYPSDAIAVNSSTGEAASQFWLGDKTGTYTVDAGLFVPLRQEHGVKISSGGGGTTEPRDPLDIHTLAQHAKVASVTFSASAEGVDLNGATHNARSLPDIGTFILNIPADNAFTALVNPVPGGGGTVNFTINPDGANPVSSAGSSGGSGIFTSGSLNMANLQAGTNVLKVEANTGSSQYSDLGALHAISFPAWITPLSAVCTSLSSEFQPAEERYHVGFSYPVDFVWSNTISGAVLLLGGKKNESNLSFNADAFYHLNQTASLTAKGSLSSTVLGWDFEANGELSGSFDEQFRLIQGSGNLHTTIPFTLPQKGISHTVYVYSVPVTIALDVGGGGKVLLAGSAMLDGNLKFRKILIHPGIQVELDATASVAAFYGAAKLGVNAKPLTELEMKLLYASEAGISPTFGGRITIPVKVFGSLFWGLSGGTLASTTLGPYGFGTLATTSSSGRSVSAVRTTSAASSTGTGIPEFLAGADLAGSGAKMLLLYTADTDPAPGSVDPDLRYRFFDGTSWQSSAPVASEPDLWEMDPTVTILDNNDALALWTANDGPKDLTDLNRIFSYQDIRYSRWNGSAWSAPAWLSEDKAADGMADVSYNAGEQKAVAVWFHDPNSDNDSETRAEWDIFAATYDPATSSWTTPINLSGPDSAADYQAKVASGGPISLAVWARDEDGEFITALSPASNGTNVSYNNSDGSLYFSRHASNLWSEPAMIPGSEEGFVSWPAVGVAPDGGLALAAWSAKKNSATAGDVLSWLKTAIYNDSRQTWSTPVTLFSGGAIEEVQVVPGAGNTATVLWRTTGPMLNGAIFRAEVNLLTGSSSAPAPVSSGRGIDWGLAVARGADGAIHGLWQQFDAGSGRNTSGNESVGGLLFGRCNSASGTINGVSGETLIDQNNDSRLDLLRLGILLDLAESGDFTVQGVLRDSNGQEIATASTSGTGLAPGSQTMNLDFAGQDIQFHNVDGPYTLTDVMLIEESNSALVAAHWNDGWNTAAHKAADFASGPVLVWRGDINGDLEVTLADAIIALQVMTASSQPSTGPRPDYLLSGADVDGNQRIGQAEALSIMQQVAGLRVSSAVIK